MPLLKVTLVINSGVRIRTEVWVIPQTTVYLTSQYHSDEMSEIQFCSPGPHKLRFLVEEATVLVTLNAAATWVRKEGSLP